MKNKFSNGDRVYCPFYGLGWVTGVYEDRYCCNEVMYDSTGLLRFYTLTGQAPQPSRINNIHHAEAVPEHTFCFPFRTENDCLDLVARLNKVEPKLINVIYRFPWAEHSFMSDGNYTARFNSLFLVEATTALMELHEDQSTEPFWLIQYIDKNEFLTHSEYLEIKDQLHSFGCPRVIFRSLWTEKHWEELGRQKTRLLL